MLVRPRLKKGNNWPESLRTEIVIDSMLDLTIRRHWRLVMFDSLDIVAHGVHIGNCLVELHVVTQSVSLPKFRFALNRNRERLCCTHR